MKIAEISIKRPTLIIVLFIILTLGGLFSFSNLSYELIPKFEINVVTISTVYPGASPAEVENTVTRKIEDAVSSLELVKKVESKSYEGLSLVMVTLQAQADADYSLNDAQRKINAILKNLPDDVDPPSLSKFSISDLPVITLAATGKMDETEFYDLLDKKIEPLLARVNGVAQVTLVGGQEREIEVSLDQDKLKGYGLAIPAVQQAILTSNLDFPTGSVKTRNNTMSVRLSGKYRSVDELRNLIVSNKNGVQIRLGDIADVQDSQKEVKKIARVNQKSAIAIQIIKQTDANAVSLSKEVRASIGKIEKEYEKQGLKLEVANDTSEFTLVAADGVIHDLFYAVFLVAFVMLFFLHSIRNAFIVMVSIPASLIATFIGIYVLGYTLNLMSLLGLSLVVGILVDDAIVVLENIYRHMEMGKNRARAAYDGASEIGFTVMAITLVIIVVFLPIAMSTGFVSNILRQFCVVVVIATMLSLLSSFTLIPWLSSRFGKLEHVEGKNLFGRIILGFERGLDRFTNWISGILKWSLARRRNKVLSLLIIIVLFASSLALAIGGFIGGEFFPKMDRGQFIVQLEMAKDASVEQSNFMTQQAEKYLASQKEVTSLITTVGQQSGGFSGVQETPYKSEITVTLVDRKQRSDNTFIYAAKAKRAIEKTLVGVKVKTVPVSIMGGADDAPLALTFTANDEETAMAFAEKAAHELEQVSGATEVKLTSENGTPEINVKVDRDKMAALGLNLQTVGLTMQTAFNGNTDGKFRAGQYEYDINIRFNEFDRSNVDNVRNLSFVNDQGQQVKLLQFATVTEGSGPSLLERRDKSASVMVQAQTVGKSVQTVANEWEARLNKLQRPSGVNWVWGGEIENSQEGFGTLGFALLAAIILVYLVMVALYNSFVYPFVVLFSVPLSFIGALYALALTNNTLNIFTILGVIMLIGLVCKNAILLVDFTNHRKEAGETTFNALVQANHARLRPILMTTIAMVFGMVPIAVASGAAAEMNNGLAWVIIGGLISSLFLTLIIVPVVYSIFDGLIARVRKGKKEANYTELMAEDYEAKELSDDGFTTKHSI
jgi:HAE1 family hydrophobic/amphiphilic exporter-1